MQHRESAVSSRSSDQAGRIQTTNAGSRPSNKRASIAHTVVYHWHLRVGDSSPKPLCHISCSATGVRKDVGYQYTPQEQRNGQHFRCLQPVRKSPSTAALCAGRLPRDCLELGSPRILPKRYVSTVYVLAACIESLTTYSSRH